MTKYALIQSENIIQILDIEGNTDNLYHESIKIVEVDTSLGVEENWQYNDETGFTPPVGPSQAELLAAANAERNSLLSYAAIKIAPYQDAVDLNIATEEESSMLTKWKEYRVSLGRLETTSGWPKKIKWPKIPE